MINDSRLLVTRNGWWNPDLRVAMFEQGLETSQREKAEMRAIDLSERHLEVAEEIDPLATQKLLTVLESSPEAAQPIVAQWLRDLPDYSHTFDTESEEPEV